MKTNQYARDFVMQRALEAIRDKERDAYEKLVQQPDPKLEEARALEKEFSARYKELQKTIRDLCAEYTQDVLDTLYPTENPSARAKEIQADPYYPTERARRLIELYEGERKEKIRSSTYSTKNHQLLKDFELQVVLSDSKELARQLDRFIKSLK